MRSQLVQFLQSTNQRIGPQALLFAAVGTGLSYLLLDVSASADILLPPPSSGCSAKNARLMLAPEFKAQPYINSIFNNSRSSAVRTAAIDCTDNHDAGGKQRIISSISRPQDRQWSREKMVLPDVASSQCNSTEASSVLRQIYAPELASTPVLLNLFANPDSAVVRAAVNDCMAGREGGGRQGMQAWIQIPQNRRWYWDNLISQPLASLKDAEQKSQCNSTVANSVLRNTFSSEIVSTPVLADLFADPNSTVVRAAINDCRAGREGGGRQGMQAWIEIPQNRRWYWDNLISQPLASLKDTKLKSQCNSTVANLVLRKTFSSEVVSTPVLADLFADPNSAVVRAAINDCRAGREGGGRQGMQAWIQIPQNRRWYWDNLIAQPLSKLKGSTTRIQPILPPRAEPVTGGRSDAFSSHAMAAQKDAASSLTFLASLTNELTSDPVLRRSFGGELFVEANALTAAGKTLLTSETFSLSVPCILSGNAGSTPQKCFTSSSSGIDESLTGSVALLHQIENQSSQSMLVGLRLLDQVHPSPVRWGELALLQLDDSGLPPGVGGSIAPSQARLDWKALGDAQKLVLSIQLAAKAQFASDFFQGVDNGLGNYTKEFSKFVKAACDEADKIEMGFCKQMEKEVDLEVKNKTSFGKVIKQFRQLQAAALVAKLGRVMSMLGVSLLPARITDFYIDVGNQKRLEGAPPVSLPVGQRVPFSASVITASKGWSVSLRQDALVAGIVNRFITKFPSLRYLRSTMMQDLHGLYVTVVRSMIRQYPPLARRIDSDLNFKLIPVRKYPAFQLNDPRYVNVQSRSPSLLMFVSSPGNPKANLPWQMIGLAPTGDGSTAGYQASLTANSVYPNLPSLYALAAADAVQPRVRGEVVIAGQKKEKTKESPSVSPRSCRPVEPCNRPSTGTGCTTCWVPANEYTDWFTNPRTGDCCIMR